WFFLQDVVGNYRQPRESDLIALGFPTKLTVTSTPDTTVPVLQSLSFTPTSIDTTTGNRTVTVTARITDDVSGFGSASVNFYSPSRAQQRGAGFIRISGDKNDGVYQATVTFPQYGEGGVWYVDWFFLQDVVGNYRQPRESDLIAQGFPTKLTITGNDPPTLLSPGNQSVNELATLAFALSASDPNSADTLSYSIASGALSGMSLGASSGAFSWTPTEAQGPGGYPVTFRVTDPGGMTSSQTIIITVNEVNEPPVADAGGPYTIDQGSGLVLNGGGTDPDTGDSLTFSWDLNNDVTFGDAKGSSPSVMSAYLTSLLLGAGTHTIHLRVADSAGAFDTASTTLTIRGTQAITFDPIANHTYGDAPFTISATASSGLPVTFTSLTPSVATVSGNTVTIVGAGSATIRASQAGNASYQPAPDVDRTFTVAKATPVIAWANPADINCLTPLGTAQLNATANVPGAFTYIPPAGTTLGLGSAQVLTTTFTPADSANYSAASATTAIAVRSLLAVQPDAFSMLEDGVLYLDAADVTSNDSPCADGMLRLVGLAPQSTSGAIVSPEPAWVAHLGPTTQLSAAAVTTDAAGNIIVAGSEFGTNRYDMVTVKMDRSGVPIWTNRFDGAAPNSDDWPVAVGVDALGNVYVTGSSGASYITDIVTLKYDASGTPLWTNIYNGPAGQEDSPNAIAVDAAGNVAVTGGSRGPNNIFEFVTLKYNTAGSSLWSKRYGGPGSYSRANQVALDGSGNVYVTGPSTGATSHSDYATLKYGPDGTLLWAARYMSRSTDWLSPV
ncbi:MAG: SBBP repeat-containing protein, partial [Planctomycetota bacterium]